MNCITLNPCFGCIVPCSVCTVLKHVHTEISNRRDVCYWLSQANDMFAYSNSYHETKYIKLEKSKENESEIFSIVQDD